MTPTPSAQTVTADDPYSMTVANLRRRSQAVYLACEEPVAKDISEALIWAADEIANLREANHHCRDSAARDEKQIATLTTSLAAASARIGEMEKALRLVRPEVERQRDRCNSDDEVAPYEKMLAAIDATLSQAEEGR